MWWNGLAVLLSLDMTGGGMKETLCMCTFLSCMSSFMLPQWEHFYRGKLEHSGVTEGQFFAMIFPLLAYLCGFKVFLETELQMIVSPNTTAPATGLAAQMKMGLGEAASRAVYAVYAPTTHVMEPLMMGACLYPLILSIATVVRVAMLRNGSGFDPCITILPWLVHIAATVLMVTSGMLERHGLIVYLLMGCQFSKCSLRMVVRNLVECRTGPFAEWSPYVVLAVTLLFVGGVLPVDMERQFFIGYFALVQVPTLVVDIAVTARQLKGELKLPYLTVPAALLRRNKRA
jgi:hypothetical protein